MSIESYLANRIKAKLVSAGTNYIQKKIKQHTGIAVQVPTAQKEVPEIVQKAAIMRLRNSIKLAHKRAGITTGKIEHRYDAETGLHHVSIHHSGRNADLEGIVTVRQPGVELVHHEYYPGYKDKRGNNISGSSEVSFRVKK